MRQLSLRHWAIAALVLAVLTLAVSDFALAQEAAEAATAAKPETQKSMFKMFFTSSDHIGQFLIICLIIMSVGTTALVIDAVNSNKTKVLMPPKEMAEYDQLADEKRYTDLIAKASTDPSLFGQVLNASLAQAPQGYGAMERAIEEYADLLGTQRIRKLEYLNVMGAIGPMAGLFGTVYGMIIAFEAMVSAGGQPKPAELAAGVSTALVNTFWGLVVAIPAIVAAALVRSHIEGTVVKVMVRAETLISRFRPAKKKPEATTSGASAKPQPQPRKVATATAV